MKPLRVKIQEECKNKNVLQTVIEKDYALSYILAGIASHSYLKNNLVFKGGTALKKIYFGDYRFSEDLDFSSRESSSPGTIENALMEAIKTSENLLMAYGPFEVGLKRKAERAPHPTGQEAFSIHVKFPWQREVSCRIKVEVTHDEPVILPPVEKSIIHGYEENLECKINCYSLEEIVAEKLRALLQTHQKLVSRGWNKPRARDYYDLWSILREYSNSINAAICIETLIQKCQVREVTYQNTDDFFTTELVREAKQYWQSSLGNLIKELPDFNQVLSETKSLINNFLFLGDKNIVN